MTREQRANVEALFDGLADAPEEFVAKMLGGCPDGEVRAEVERLLRGARAQDFRVTEFRDSFAQLAGELASDLPAGTQLDQFEVVEKVGEGGMGAVYRATQKMTRRVVALKLIRPNLLSPQLVRRFLFEVEVLGKLNHPSIARVFAAGIAAVAGGARQQPFFAMEWIDGVPLDRYIDANNPSRRERLLLLQRIAAAVDHAHSRGVVHRDLKPANVIVQADGTPKVVDFGVACATTGERGGGGRLTEIDNAVIGTLAYMAPEQLLGRRDQIDPETDVYALGVVGYEVLAGRRPHDLNGLSVFEATRSVCETDPPPPGKVNPLLRGDVDAVLMKAMERDKARRYRTAHGLAEDLRRILDYEPVSARQQTRAYRLARFVRRNRNAVAAGAVLVLLLVAGVTGTSIGLYREAKARKSAESQRDALNTVLSFVTKDLLGSADPANSGGRDMTVKEVVDGASKRVGQRFANQPEVEHSISSVLGSTYTSLGRPADALPHAKLAWDLAQKLYGADSVQAIEDGIRYAGALRDVGRATEAEPMLRDIIARGTRLLGSEHQHVLQSYEALGRLLETVGRTDEALVAYRTMLDGTRKHFGPDDHEMILATGNYAGGLIALERLAEAEPLFADCAKRSEKLLGPDHPETLGALNNQAYCLRNLDRLKEAEPVYRDLLTRVRRVLGDDHPNTLTVAGSVASLNNALEHFDEAEKLYREVFERTQRTLGPDHPDSIWALHNLAYFHTRRGRYAEAEPMHRQAVERAVVAADYGPKHPFTLTAAKVWARCLDGLGRKEEATQVRSRFPASAPSTQSAPP